PFSIPALSASPRLALLPYTTLFRSAPPPSVPQIAGKIWVVVKRGFWRIGRYGTDSACGRQRCGHREERSAGHHEIHTPSLIETRSAPVVSSQMFAQTCFGCQPLEVVLMRRR